MANFDTGLLGFMPNDEEKYKEYMIRSMRPDLYDRTQPMGGYDINQLIEQMQTNRQQPEGMVQPGVVQQPQTEQLQKGLLGAAPTEPQQESQPVEVQETPEVMVDTNADELAKGSGATSGAANMAQSAQAADADAAASAKQLEAKKDQQASETMQMALAEQKRKEQEEQGLFSQIFGMGMQLLPYFL